MDKSHTEKNRGEPGCFRFVKDEKSCDNMVSAMKSMGYLQADASYNVAKKNKKATVRYTINPNVLYYVDSVKYVIEDETLLPLLEEKAFKGKLLKRGIPFQHQLLMLSANVLHRFF